ncbi:MAG: protein-disulfide reductase DsbD family protein, partial [Gammaproteobacteria bacterium]|nr:protein-disulfide reductase DsbD family protein [Gammaproteobacteria bacterium]
MTRPGKSFLLLVLLGISSLSLSLLANPVKPGKVEVALISEMTSIKPGATQRLALVQRIDPGWHTYWINPGDSGASTTLSWMLPEGVTVGDVQWPAPEAIPYGPLMNYGYHNEVVFPVDIKTPASWSGEADSRGKVELRLMASWLVCEDICIPEDAELVLSLPVSDAPLTIDAVNKPLFDAASQYIPQLLATDATIHVDKDELILNIPLSHLQSSRIRDVRYFPLNVDLIDNTADQVVAVGEAGMTLKMAKAPVFDESVDDYSGVLVLREHSGEDLQVQFLIEPIQQDQVAVTAGISLWLAFLYAFLGGLILNLMPCVFPVLSIKVLSLVQHQDLSRATIRMNGLVYLAGVVLSFLLVAGALMALRSGGAAIGWGFQLQSPVVVSLLASLFFVIGLNLSGVFEWGTRLMSMGGSAVSGDSAGGNHYRNAFLTGVLAVIVASPCTAPFMGAALGYALLQPGPASMVIFLGLGLGMGLPFVALCYFPRMLKRLPKPGAWMAGFKEFLAFPMYGSAVWLIWVLSQQAGSHGVLVVLTGLVLIAQGIWLLNLKVVTRWRKMVARGLGFVCILASLIMTWSLSGDPVISAAASGDHAGQALQADKTGPAWQAYSPALLEELRASGPVFVNFTAAWCITCKVNEVVSLNTEATKKAFADAGIAYLKGDWTNEDPQITRVL